MEHFIPISYVRDRIKMFYDLTDTKKDSFIDLTILNSIRDIDSYKYIEIKDYELEVCDLKATLPCEFKKLIAVIPPCESGCVPFIYTEYSVDGCECARFGLNKTFSISGDLLLFPERMTYEHVRVICQVFRVDSQGFPVILKDHLTYYETYAKYHVGLHLGDARYKAFSNYKNVRKNLIHNEKADLFQLQKEQTAVIMQTIGNVLINSRANNYLGLYGRQLGQTNI